MEKAAASATEIKVWAESIAGDLAAMPRDVLAQKNNEFADDLKALANDLNIIKICVEIHETHAPAEGGVGHGTAPNVDHVLTEFLTPMVSFLEKPGDVKYSRQNLNVICTNIRRLLSGLLDIKNIKQTSLYDSAYMDKSKMLYEKLRIATEKERKSDLIAQNESAVLRVWTLQQKVNEWITEFFKANTARRVTKVKEEYNSHYNDLEIPDPRPLEVPASL